MENKSKCCQTIYGQCSRCGGVLTNNHQCNPIFNVSEIWPQKKNTGLTLSEIAADEDVLEFRKPNGITFDRDIGSYPWDKNELAATDWVVTKRKSDEAVNIKEGANSTMTTDNFRIQQLRKEIAELKEKLTWKKWPENRPTNHNAACLVRKDSAWAHLPARFEDEHFKCYGIAISGSFEFLELL